MIENVKIFRVKEISKISILLIFYIVIGCSKSPEEAFTDAKAINTVQNYKEFLKDYPEAPAEFVEDATNRLHKLAFEQTEQINSIKSYEDYAREYPKSVYTEEAEERAYKLSLIGKRGIFYESREYTLEEIWGGLLKRTVTYEAQFTGVIEQVFGENLKLIIESVDISDPSRVSISYMQNRDYALSDFQEDIGKTRVVSIDNVKIQ